jgi:Zn-dependent protease with chaperone function
VGVVLGLLAVAAVLVVTTPLVMCRGHWQPRLPRLALSIWCAAFVGGLLALAASLVCAVVLAADRQQGSGSPGAQVSVGALIVVCGWAGLAGVGGLVSLVLSRSEPLTTMHRRTEALFTLLAGSASYRTLRVGSVVVSFVESDLPIAMSLPGPGLRVVLTSRLERELSWVQVQTVIEHERTHLIQRHAWIAQLAHLNLACLPRMLGAQEFVRASRLLVELIADDAAARVCGGAETAAALSRLAQVTHDEGLDLRSRRITAHPPRQRRVLRRGSPAVWSARAPG